MRLRWNFHRLMLGQSLSFYQDEFAGRVSAKVMQTALAVRDTVMTIADMLVYVAVYFITSGLVLAALDTWFLAIFNDRTYYGCLLKYCNGKTIFT